MSEALSFRVSVFAFLFALSASAAGLDSSVLPAKSAPKNQERTRPAKSNERPPSIKLDDESKLRNAIDSLTLIIKKTPAGLGRNKLILNRAKTELQLVQSRLLKSKALLHDSYEKNLIARVRNDAEFVDKDQASTLQMRAQAYFLEGLCADDTNDIDRAIEYFKQSIALDPKSADSGWMGFYIAEQYFEEKKYRESIETYRSFYARWNGKTQKLVLYKMGWAYINIDRIDEAEKYFTVIIRVGAHDEVEKDALRDLAYISGKFKTDKDIIQLADRTFRTDADKVAFYSAVYDQQETQGMVSNRSTIFAKILETEKDPVQRIKFKIRGLSSLQRGYASVTPYEAFLEVRKMIDNESLTAASPQFGVFGANLNEEAQRLIRAYVDTFSGKAQTPEKLTREQMGTSLRLLFATYDQYFPKDPVRVPILSLWLDVCVDLKDWSCINQVGLEIAGDIPDEKTRPALRSRAEIERLAALDELTKSDASKYRSDLIKAAEHFVATSPQSPRWEGVANRLADLYVEDKKFVPATDLLNRIYQTIPSQKSFYRLQWVRFSQENYKELLADKRNATLKDAPDPRLAELYRESALKMALKARADGNLADYSAQIQNFIAFNNDPKKTLVARRDFFGFLIERGDMDGATRALAALPPQERCSKDYDDLLNDLCVKKLRAGDFKDIPELLPAPQCAHGDFQSYRMVALIGVAGKPDPSLLLALPPVKRSYFLSVLALAQPKFVISFFDDHGPKNETERAAQQIAVRLVRGRWDEAPVKVSTKPLFSERKIQELVFPKASDKHFTAKLKFIVESVPLIRKWTIKGMKGRTPEVQIRMLSAAEGFEKKVAGLILNSPIPPGLSEEQLKEYRAGLSGMAKGYTDQAAEYAKLAAAEQKVIDDGVKHEQDLIIPVPAQSKWAWPKSMSDSVAKPIWTLVEKTNSAGALLIADLNRDHMLKDDHDYFAARAGVLLYGNRTLKEAEFQVMQRYVLDELKAQKMDDVIQQWRGPQK